MGLKGTIERIEKFLLHDIWQLDMETISHAKARFVRYVRVLFITIRTFSSERIGNQAVCLSFFGTMAMVPFIAVTFAITDGFGLREYLQRMIYEYFDTSQEVVDQVIKYADNIIAAAQSNALGLISALLFVWLIFWMMLNVEAAFNHVWKVKKSRNFLRRLAVYGTILLISPFVVLIMFSAFFMYGNAFDSIGFGAEVTDTLKSGIAWIVVYVLTVLVLTAMYKFIPNKKVYFGPAFRAALISALFFVILQYLYIETQLFVARLSAIYGAVAAIPLFMFWMNFCWFIILFGAEISYAFQNVNNYNLDD
ncbi:MAG: YihY/virulence factor BrkB family protein [Bacteroidetes bacterium]|uniref:YihY/virulence factor BrkB family protein n=1 Tax=Candidatus Merdivivens pullicola TaxID=2840872 RepID=A0A9D9IIB5_9BACT|nr:YihY/virulence factor BrkB family protein [Candidatus Merdivivens pullicola]